MTAVRFGTLGVAQITPRALLHPVDSERNARVVAVAARDRERATAFAAHEHIPHVLNDYQEVIDHPDVNAIYNPLVISLHKPWSIRALEAGKHVLCEKSFALNEAEAQAMADVAAARGLVLMDAFHYRYHPVFVRAVDIVRSGLIGEVEHVEGYFHIPVNDPDNIRMKYELGGGVTMDIGCYPISWLRHVTGQEPTVVGATATVGPPGVDLTMVAQFRFPNGATGTSSGDMAPDTRFRADLTVRGSAGSLYVQNPLVPQMGHELVITNADGERRETFDRRPSYGYQLDAFIDAVMSGAELLTGAEDAVRQMRVIDAVYRAAGMTPRGTER